MPNDGFMLDYWLWKTESYTPSPDTDADGDGYPDANIITNPVDNSKTTITEIVTENRTYLAVFKLAAPILSGSAVKTQYINYYGWDYINADGRTNEEIYRSYGIGSIRTEDQSKPSESIAEFKEAYLVLNVNYPYRLQLSEQKPLIMNLYEGTKEDGDGKEPFAKVYLPRGYLPNDLQTGNDYAVLVPEMPNMTSFTVEAFVNGEGTSTATYTLQSPVIPDALSTEKKSALSELKSGYEGYATTAGLTEIQSEQLDAIYKQGRNDIIDATTAEKVTEKLNGALQEMAAVLSGGGSNLYVAVTVEAFKAEQGLIVKPTVVEITEGANVFTAIRRALKATYTDVDTNDLTKGGGSYIAAVYLPGYTGSYNGENYLGEKDEGTDSGWVYCVDGVFPGIGVGEKTVAGGETIRLQYTVSGYGSDVQPASDKDDLIMTVAQLRAIYSDEQLTGSATENPLTNEQTSAYNAAYALVNTLFVDADDADEANTALREAFEEVFAPVDPDVKAVIDLIKAIGTVTLESKDAIEAAEAAYDILTPEQKAAVRNYQTLVDARATYDILMGLSADDPAIILNGVLAYLAANVDNPGVSSLNGEWAVLAMARGSALSNEAKAAYLSNLDSALASGTTITKWTDYERVTLALSALGIDATAYGTSSTNLLAPYAVFTPVEARNSTDQTLMADIYALIALNAKPYTGEQSSYVDAICEAALQAGGWNLDANASVANVDVTAMAIQALAPYYDTNSIVTEKVDSALTWLKAQQDPYTGGYGESGVVNTESTAQVVTALCALGIDPDGAAWTVDSMTPLSALTLWYNEAGWFGHTGTSFDQMATEQAAYALVAWKRFSEERNALYDMRDMFPNVASDDASVDSLAVKGMTATAGSNGAFTVELPYRTDPATLTAEDFTITAADGATWTVPATADGGETWTFTVTAEDGTTQQTYTVTVTVAEKPDVSVKSLTVDVEGATVAAEDENHNFAVVLPYGTEPASLTKDSFTITLAEGATRSELSTQNGGETWSFTVTAKDGTTQQTYTISVSVSTDNPEQNQADVDAVLAQIPATMTTSYSTVTNATQARTFVLKELGNLNLDSTVSRSVEITKCTASIAGTEENPDGTDGSFTAKVTLSKGEGATLATAEIIITGTIKADAYVDPNATITVTFRLVGAYPATQDVDLGKSDYMPEYVTWIPTTEYTIPIDSTMEDLFTMAMNDAGLTSIGAQSNYVKTIYAPDVLTGYELSEFTNGQNSGWMYTVNGSHPGVGLGAYTFASNADVVASGTAEVVWHYVNDWVWEQEDYAGTLGNASTWNKWLDAADTAPTAVSATSIELDQTSTSVAPGSTVTLTATVLPSYALDKTVIWTSSNVSVVTVDETGVVTGVKAGTATITATAGDFSAACEVTVTDPNLPKIDSVTPDKTEAETGDSITWTAAASGGAGSYRYCFYVFKDGAVVERGAYGAANSYTYTPEAAGVYTVRAYVKDSAGKSATLNNAGAVTVTEKVVPVLAVDSVTPDKTEAETGDSITWTAAASGASGAVKYCFYVFKDGVVEERGAYGTANSYTYTAETAGVYTVRVYLKDASGASATLNNAGSVTVTEKAVPVLAIDSVTPSVTEAEVGDSITWTAEASGASGAVKYCFYVFKNGAVEERGSYGAANTYTYTPEAAGAYTVRVYVKDASGAAATLNNAGAVTLAEKVVPLLAVDSVTPDKTEAEPGDSITWTAEATGGSGSYRYCFYVFRDGAVVERGSYGTASSYTYTAETAGVYTVRVYVKDTAGAAATLNNAGAVTVAAPGPLAIESVTPSVTQAEPGDSITWTAAASGGSGSYRYCFYVFKDGVVEERGSYGTANSYTYTAETAGTYTVRVYLKDTAGTAVTLDKAGSVTVAAPGPLAIESVTPSVTEAEPGDSITWTAEASGGSGSYRYCFYVFRNGIVAERGTYGTANSYTYTAETAGVYTVRVYVKDTAGETVTLNDAGSVSVAG